MKWIPGLIYEVAGGSTNIFAGSNANNYNI